MRADCLKRKEQGFIPIFAIIGFVMMSGLILTVLYFKQQNVSPVTQKDNVLVNNTTAQKSNPDTEKFKTYTNSSLSFQFQYPNDLIAKEDTEEAFNQRGGGDFRKNFQGYVQYQPAKFISAVVVLGKDKNFDLNPFSLWIFDNPDSLTIDDWYRNYWYYPFVWGDFTYTGKFDLAPKTEATISGQPAKAGLIDYQPGKPKFVYLSVGKKMYLFRIIDNAVKVGEKILSTFKLTGGDNNTPDIGGCQIAGCSNQLCVESDAKNTISTCIYSPTFACYKNAKCAKQANGKCGWTQTDELKQCLQNTN